jgi:flagellar protein FliO/FliZ
VIDPGVPSETDGLASLSLAIGGIVTLLWGAVWALRRVRSGADTWGARDCAIVRSIALGPRERLVVVRVGARHLVIGVGSAAVSLVCELDEPLPPVAPANEKFSNVIRKAAERWRAG